MKPAPDDTIMVSSSNRDFNLGIYGPGGIYIYL